MPTESVLLSEIVNDAEAGQPVQVPPGGNLEEVDSAFIVWLPITDGKLPCGTEPPDDCLQVGDKVLLGFSSACPHMGCNLVTDQDLQSTQTKSGHFVCGPCRCHGSTFDLARNGLVVLGPATQNLPRLALEFTDSNEDKVQGTGWISQGIHLGPDPNHDTWPENI